MASVTKEFFLAVLLISSERRLVPLTDSKHLYYELLAGCGGALNRGRGGSLGESSFERELPGRGSKKEGGREGGRALARKNEI